MTNEEIKQFYAYGLFPCLQKTEKNSGFVFRGCRKSKTIENEITNDKIFVVRLLQKALYYDAENWKTQETEDMVKSVTFPGVWPCFVKIKKIVWNILLKQKPMAKVCPLQMNPSVFILSLSGKKFSQNKLLRK